MTPNGPRFISAFHKLVPGWLADEDEGEKVLFSLGVIKDAFVERTLQGLLARFPEHAPEDALTALGRDRRVVRGLNEGVVPFARRLVRAPDTWKTWGAPFTLIQEIRDYLGVGVRIRTVDQRGNWFTIEANGTKTYSLNRGNWNWDNTPATNWSRFWVVIFSTGGIPWTQTPLYNGAGAIWGSTEFTWGSSAKPEEVAAIRSIVREKKPAHAKCEAIIISFDSAAFDPALSAGGPGMPDGLWGKWGKRVSGTSQPSRYASAAYWDGG